MDWQILKTISLQKNVLESLVSTLTLQVRFADLEPWEKQELDYLYQELEDRYDITFPYQEEIEKHFGQDYLIKGHQNSQSLIMIRR